MTNVNKLIQNHRSIRSFIDKDIPEEMLDSILFSAQAMPTSHNNQDISVIVLRDNVKKNIIAELSGNQKHIKDAPVFLIFVADLFKTHLACKKNNMVQNLENHLDTIITATFDAGIAMGAAIISAESLGLGITPIGGIRNNIAGVSKILELPEYTFPLVGLCLGFPYNIPDKKPRFPLPAFAHEEVYQKEAMEGYINEYDEIMNNYLIKIQREQEVNWSYRTSTSVSKPSSSAIESLLKEQKIIVKSQES
ncbi:MAG: NADPH-dependent oxidoreductase [Alphaproteobacteria bacterium]|jgi:FMN reductase [NAD(P)H]|nr:NADPH-dependent oxidoreductase [Alphaproteobacteria bacterium]